MTDAAGCAEGFRAQPGDTLEAVARRHRDLAAHKRDLSMVEDELVDTMHTLAGGKLTFDVDGIGCETTFRPVAPKTDGERLYAVVVAAGRDERLVDRETGEALESEGEAVARAISDVYPVLNSSVNPRSTALKKRHIDLGEFRSVGGWVKTVRWHG